MESEYEVALGRSRAPLVWRALIEPLTQGVEIDLKDEDLVEQIDELPEVARASAKEGDRLAMVGCLRPYKTYVPDVVLMDGGIERFAGLGIALVGKLSVTVEGLVSTPAQL